MTFNTFKINIQTSMLENISKLLSIIIKFITHGYDEQLSTDTYKEKRF